jgi:hypothetical protein
MALGSALSPTQTPRPQQPGLDEALMPMQGSGEAVVAQNYNGWRSLLSNPAMTAAMLQYAVSLTGDTGRGTAGDIANALGAAGGAAGRTAEAEKKRADEQKALEAQQAQQQLENDMAKQRLDLEKQRVDIARASAGRRSGAGSKASDPVKLAETQWKAAYEAWAAAEPLPGQPDTRGPAPDLNDYIFRQQDIQTAIANGMNYGDYKAAEGVDPALAYKLLEGYKTGAEQGQKVIDEYIGIGDPTMDVGLGEPAPAPAETSLTPTPPNAYDLPALEPDAPAVRVIKEPAASTAELARPKQPWALFPELRELGMDDALWSTFSPQQQETLLDSTVAPEVKKAIVFAKKNFTGGLNRN